MHLSHDIVARRTSLHSLGCERGVSFRDVVEINRIKDRANTRTIMRFNEPRDKYAQQGYASLRGLALIGTRRSLFENRVLLHSSWNSFIGL